VKRALLGAAAAGAAAAGVGVLPGDQAPYPYAQHRLLDVPPPLLTRRRLDAVLEPGPASACWRSARGPACRHFMCSHVPLATLVRLADDAGLHLRRRTGIPLAYYALLHPCRAQDGTRYCPGGDARWPYDLGQ